LRKDLRVGIALNCLFFVPNERLQVVFLDKHRTFFIYIIKGIDTVVGQSS
jgi:hypothetical protein